MSERPSTRAVSGLSLGLALGLLGGWLLGLLRAPADVAPDTQTIPAARTTPAPAGPTR